MYLYSPIIIPYYPTHLTGWYNPHDWSENSLGYPEIINDLSLNYICFNSGSVKIYGWLKWIKKEISSNSFFCQEFVKPRCLIMKVI